MWRDLLEDFLVETRAFRWLARAALVLFLLGVTSPLMLGVDYFANREQQSICHAIRPAFERLAADAATAAPRLNCPRLRLRP